MTFVSSPKHWEVIGQVQSTEKAGKVTGAPDLSHTALTGIPKRCS